MKNLQLLNELEKVKSEFERNIAILNLVLLAFQLGFIVAKTTK